MFKLEQFIGESPTATRAAAQAKEAFFRWLNEHRHAKYLDADSSLQYIPPWVGIRPIISLSSRCFTKKPPSGNR